MKIERLKQLLFVLLMAVPSAAQADMFSLYVSGKSGFVNGSGSAFTDLNSAVGAGAEAGIELIGIDIFGEALKVGDDQFYFTANLGFDATFGDDWRWTFGAHTGPMVFLSPREQSAPFALSGTTRSALTAQGIDPDMVETQYNEVRELEDELNRYTLGWNIVRASIRFERRLVPLVYIGVSAYGAYHYLLRGEEIAAHEKQNQLSRLDEQYGLSNTNPQVASQIRAEMGAQSIDQSKLGGFNYNVSAYFKIEI